MSLIVCIILLLVFLMSGLFLIFLEIRKTNERLRQLDLRLHFGIQYLIKQHEENGEE